MKKQPPTESRLALDGKERSGVVAIVDDDAATREAIRTVLREEVTKQRKPPTAMRRL